MKEHVWVTEEVNCGHIGVEDFWVCHGCEASGGPVFDRNRAPSFSPFFADGSALKLSDDCDEAAEEVRAHKQKKADLAALPVVRKSAKGVQGFLLKSFDGRFLFRVYTSEDKQEFTDYRIAAEDIQIIIDDDKVLIEEPGKTPKIDWSYT